MKIRLRRAKIKSDFTPKAHPILKVSNNRATTVHTQHMFSAQKSAVIVRTCSMSYLPQPRVFALPGAHRANQCLRDDAAANRSLVHLRILWSQRQFCYRLRVLWHCVLRCFLILLARTAGVPSPSLLLCYYKVCV